MASKKIITQEVEIGGKKVTLEYGRFAEKANSAVIARMCDTMVFVSVTSSPSEVPLDYFPLTVDYMMRLYAGGRIKGSRWVKREGRPSDEEILTCRLIDRSIRPLFPKTMRKEVQVIAMVLSIDGENDPAIVAMIGTSAALATSSLPWKGPVGSLRIGEKDGTYFALPTDSELAYSSMDLILTTDKESIFMIEAGANEVPEEKILGALEFGQKEAQILIQAIEEFAEKVGTKKEKYEEKENKELVDTVKKKYTKEIEEFIEKAVNTEGRADLTEITNAITEELGAEVAKLIPAAIEKVKQTIVRDRILSGTRLDGRKHDEVRPISCEVGILPRTHGSAVFKRGQTQVMTVTTLGAPNLSQLLETAEGEETKRYIHHYNFPPYSTGETGRVGSPGRREIGHGALAERALLPVVPGADVFPYTIHLVSEVMSSNGSTSMASTCGSTLSLMDAGVPLKAPISGIAMGLVIEGEVVRIQPFGAFVQVLPGKDGLVHVSDMAEGFVQNPEDVVSIGDKVQVRVKEVDNLGRINLSMRMDPATDKPREERGGRGRDDSPRSRFGPPRREAGEVGRRSFGPRRGPSVFDDRRGGSARGRGDDRGPRRPAGPRRERSEGERGSRQEGGVGGPHFPASRLVPSKRRF